MKTFKKIAAVALGLFLVANVEAAPISTLAGVGLIVWAITGKK